ncbi:MAG: hypothetical protein M3505_10140, partial [Verrucomicrobiota bacterium]|nr:hypothetical protein [Verrucomicrobiota bacterium]
MAARQISQSSPRELKTQHAKVAQRFGYGGVSPAGFGVSAETMTKLVIARRDHRRARRPPYPRCCAALAPKRTSPVDRNVAEAACVAAPADRGCVEIRGARQNNLKGIDLDLPLGQMTVIAGPSGSGKSSLAFETIYAEGQRRYVETFSPYMRQFLDRMDKPR